MSPIPTIGFAYKRRDPFGIIGPQLIPCTTISYRGVSGNMVPRVLRQALHRAPDVGRRDVNNKSSVVGERLKKISFFLHGSLLVR